MPFPIGGPLEPSLYLTVSEIFNDEYITQWLTWHTTSKQRSSSRSFILVPIDFLCTTFYNFCPTTHRLATIHSVQTDRRQTDATRRSLVTASALWTVDCHVTIMVFRTICFISMCIIIFFCLYLLACRRIKLHKDRTKYGRLKNHAVFALVCNSCVWCYCKIQDQPSWNHCYLTGSWLASDNAVLNCCSVMQDHF